jgi:cobalt-zinc-cadmium efflux system outer membrane protein
MRVSLTTTAAATVLAFAAWVRPAAAQALATPPAVGAYFPPAPVAPAERPSPGADAPKGGDQDKPKGTDRPALPWAKILWPASRPGAGGPTDAAVRRVQNAPAGPGPATGPSPTGPLPLAPPEPTPPGASMPAALNALEGGGTSIALQAALYGALTGNPDLVALRNSNIASPEAVEVARRFPTTLNPTLWVDYRPINLIPPDTFGGATTGPRHGPYYHFGRSYFYVSYRQPVELGHQTTHRHAVAKAALNQQQWTVVQAELLALVQTYRFFETAAYRREKLRVSNDLAEFNDRLLDSLKRRLEANQAAASDVVLGEVENRATRQQVEVARQDYANALADLRNQLGMPETAAVEPFGAFILPHAIPEIDEPALIQLALCSRPEIHVARASAAGALAAYKLARGDRFPTPVIGPLYQTDEVGVQYVGLVYITPIPILNNGKPLMRQREADYRRALVALQQVEQRTIAQVRAAVAKWNASNRLVGQTNGLTASLRDEVGRMERLFEANQANLTVLLQARQRLIQLQNAELDAVWQATQAQADLLSALGAPGLIGALNEPLPAEFSVPAGAAAAPTEIPPVPATAAAPAPAAPAPR